MLEDVVNLDINTKDAADASDRVACIAIYARFLTRNGTYSCELVFSKSKVVPDGLSQPRTDILAATLNTYTGEIVKKAFQDNHKQSVRFTDSQVTLHWINNQKKPGSRLETKQGSGKKQTYSPKRLDVCEK